jgi:hypothetical protein
VDLRAERKTSPAARRLACAAIAACSLSALTGTANATQAEYERAYELGTEAYKYGLPAVSTHRTFRIMTSVDEPDGRGDGPVNRFSHVRKLSTPDADTIVAPNEDTLYSIAWLKLKRRPMVLHVPKVKNRYFVLPLMDPYTEDFKNLGSVKGTKPGDYVITGPGQHRMKLPKGTKQVRSRYTRVWIIGRTQVRGAGDVQRVREIQRRYSLTPLNRYRDGRSEPKPPKNPDTTVDRVPMPTRLAFLDNLGKQLERFPPPDADRPQLERLASAGIGPGLKPSTDPDLSADQRRGLIDAVTDGPDAVLADLRSAYLDGFLEHDGWLVSKTGRYGTEYKARATTAQVGLGALIPKEAIYPFAQVDGSGQPLSGANAYALHLPAGEFPPAKAFWSLTMYDTAGFFVPNPIDRFAINDRTKLAYNPDGSLDIRIQADEPSGPTARQNWLPAPAGLFRLIMRIYEPRPKQIGGILDGSGWDPPSVTRLP